MSNVSRMPSDQHFDERFRQLWDVIENEQFQKGYSGPISFHNSNGLIYDEETSYKEELILKNTNVLEETTCNKYDADSLTAAVTSCIWNTQITRTGKLMSPNSALDAADRISANKRDAWNSILGVLTSASENEEAAFNCAAVFFGWKFDVVSYLFFLKDPERFFSIRSDTYGTRLAMLGYPSSCTAKCSWKNYQEYIGSLEDVQRRLAEYCCEKITIVDAESFMWMMYKLLDSSGNLKPYRRKPHPITDPLETYVSGTEGCKNGYYVTRYERDPKLRKAAAKNGDYTCSCCGMKFADVYGEFGKDFIEVHHTVPISSYDEPHDTKIDELVCVCSNCHSMIHRHKNYVLTVDELKSLMR